jgi:hypothetical protein
MGLAGAVARPARLAAVTMLCLCAGASEARGDWLITPFVGYSFAPETTFLVPGEPAKRRFTLGTAVALLSDSFLGLEAEFSHTPRFFEGDDPRGLVLTSRVTALSGSVILAVPLAVTRESLRPYVVGGLGLLQARTSVAAGIFPLEEDLLGVNIGAGAIGLISERTGFRFDLRHIKAASGADGPLARPGLSRLSFWRATVGVVLRY